MAIFLGLVVISALGVAWYIRLATRQGIMDIPNERSSHQRITPRGGGGVAVMLFVLIWGGWMLGNGYGSTSAWMLGVGGLLMAILGFWDDLHSLSARLRLALQVVIAVALVAVCGGFDSAFIPFIGVVGFGWIGLAIAILWVVGLTNVYNFMDGVDGIAGVQAVVAGLAWLAFGWYFHLPVIMVASALTTAFALGFLYFNWEPAKVFMGDVGSAFYGFIFAALPLLALAESGRDIQLLNVKVAGFAGLVVFPFVFDGVFTFIRRLKKRENVMKAHRSHLYQRLYQAGWRHSQISLFYACLAVCSAGLAFLYVTQTGPLSAGGPILALITGWMLTRFVKSWEEGSPALAPSAKPKLPVAERPDAGRLFLSPPHLSGMEETHLMTALRQNWIAPVGPSQRAFEEELARYHGTDDALATVSGTAAIHLALRLSGINPGDTVLCSTFSFIASSNPIHYLGGRPVFIDSDPHNWNLSLDALRTAVESERHAGYPPKALILVHAYGLTADLDPILDYCRQEGIIVIEDAAESLGTRYRGQLTGTFGDFAAFSFNGNKIITTGGGGLLLARNPEDLARARYLAGQAKEPGYEFEHASVGYNYRLSNVLAAVGLGQFSVFQERLKQRRALAGFYAENLSEVAGVQLMPAPDYCEPNHWLNCITIDPSLGVSPMAVIKALESFNIESRPLWKPLHLQLANQGSPYYGRGVAEGLHRHGICLPSGTAMEASDVRRVTEVVIRSLQPA